MTDERLAPGDPAPDFTLPDAEGNEVSLSKLRGHHVIIYFYPAAMTPGSSGSRPRPLAPGDPLRGPGYTVPCMAGSEDTRLWHPFADMSAVRGSELVFERGEDVWVWDEAGNRYLDATASLWYANIGHGRPEIAAAVAERWSE